MYACHLLVKFYDIDGMTTYPVARELSLKQQRQCIQRAYMRKDPLRPRASERVVGEVFGDEASNAGSETPHIVAC